MELIIAVFYYDFVLTIPEEVKYLWCSRFKIINLLVIALRYISAVGYIAVLMASFPPSASRSTSNDGSLEDVGPNRNLKIYCV